LSFLTSDLGLEMRRQSASTGSIPVSLTVAPVSPSYYDGASPDGSMVHVSIWDSEEHVGQMGRLKEMIVDARSDAEKAGGQLHPDRQLPGRLGVGFPS